MRDLPIQFNRKETNPKEKILFKEFYALVAECLGIKNAVIDTHDKIIMHTEDLNVSLSITLLQN